MYKQAIFFFSRKKEKPSQVSKKERNNKCPGLESVWGFIDGL
jgi:hypothetical protein